MDVLKSRHSKEQRDLQATVTSLKKQALKKTRKAVLAKCSQMQEDLDERQRLEVRRLNGDDDEPEELTPEALLASIAADQEEKPGATTMPSAASGVSPESNHPLETEFQQLHMQEKQLPSTDTTGSSTQTPSNSIPKKRNRAKERLAKRQAQIDAVKAEAAAEAENAVDYRKIEQESMENLLRSQSLLLHEIKPDGHCLFASVQDQLRQRHEVEASVAELRTQAAEYIRSHADDFVPFLFDESTLSLRDVSDYTSELESTAMWGLDMELLALANVYNCPIKVLTAGSAPIVFHEDGDEPLLVVAFYKHSYGLGEHYNSCRALDRGRTDS